MLLAACVALGGLGGAEAAETLLQREYKQFRTYPRLDRAYRLMKAGNYKAAQPLLEAILKIDPARKEAWTALFETCVQLRDIDCVLQRSRQRLTVMPADAEASYYLAYGLHERGDTMGAANAAEHALATQPLSADRRVFLERLATGNDRPAAPRAVPSMAQAPAFIEKPAPKTDAEAHEPEGKPKAVSRKEHKQPEPEKRHKPATEPRASKPPVKPPPAAEKSSREANEATRKPPVETRAHARPRTVEKPAQARQSPAEAQAETTKPRIEAPRAATLPTARPAPTPPPVAQVPAPLARTHDDWYQAAKAARERGDRAAAIDALQRALQLLPGNPVYQSELGYLQVAIGDDAHAVENFRAARPRLENGINLTPDIAYAELRLGRRPQALEAFRRAIDETPARNALLAVPDPDAAKKLFGLRRSVQVLEDRWRFNATTIVRLDRRSAPSAFASPQEYAGYGGLVSAEASYRIDGWPDDAHSGRAELFARALNGLNDRSLRLTSDSLLSGLGARWKLLPDQIVFASAEYLHREGAPKREDLMLRLSGSWGRGGDFAPGEASWPYANLYADYAWLVRQKSYYATVAGELGKQVRVRSIDAPVTVLPYLAASATVNNDNLAHAAISRVDVGAGVSLVSWHRESHYRAWSTRSRLSLEARTVVGGNTTDRHTMRVKWELSF